jgi:hypothetical protein
MKLIGITGPAGAGKSSFAAHLCHRHGFHELAFADPVYAMAAVVLDMSPEEFRAMCANRNFKESPLHFIDRSPRQLLQTIGTEWGRDLIDGDLWVKLLALRVQTLTLTPNAPRFIVVSDVRFENEAAFIRQHGTLLHIARPDIERHSQHVSENGVAFNHRDQLVLNHSLDLLYQQADAWANALGAA